jgi:hypothetical protein
VAKGYRSGAYARSFAARGALRHLAGADAWLLLRAVPDAGGAIDASGLYPLLACADWGALSEDLIELDGEVVSIVAVADALGGHAPEELAAAFPALVRPFKQHLVVDCELGVPDVLPSNHRRNLRRAARVLEVQHDVDVELAVPDWIRLYGELIRRHDIRGIAAFTPAELEAQLRAPGVRVVRAMLAGVTVAMQVWMVDGDAAYYHLGASAPEGYQHAASFALFDRAIRHLAEEVRVIDLGAGPGAADDREHGLVRFKRPWANRVATAYLCGRISSPLAYERLANGAPGTWFPAYRGEA